MHSKFVPLLASAGLIAFPLQNSSAIPITYTLEAGPSVSVSANRSEPSLGINTALMSSVSGTAFPLDETGQSSIRPAGRFRADRQGGMAVSYGQSFSSSRSRISTNEPMPDTKDFVHKGIVATRDFSEPSTRAGLTGSASQGNDSFGRTFSLEQTNFARDVVDWNSPASTSVLAGHTFTIELAPNAEARPKDREKSSNPILEVPKDKNKEKYAGPVASVPDSGSTALLLGTSLLVLGVASGGSMNLAFKSLAAWVRYASLQGFQNKTCKFAELARKYANTAMLAYHISMTCTLAFRWIDDVALRCASLRPVE